MKIQVTQEHINRGAPGDSLCCPIALALIEAGLSGIDVCGGAIWQPYGRKVMPWSEEMHRFIENFDEGDEVDPFEFEIPVKA